MITIRSRFYKKGDMVFISHLDLIRVFERAVRRANIPVAYTQGFNPRPIIAFATALSVGVSSEGEYIDIQLSEKMDADLFKENLNNVLPEGLQIIKSIAISNKEQSLMSVISSSTYLVKLKVNDITSKEYIEELISKLLNCESIIQIKQKKNRSRKRNKKPEFREINIRPLIKSIELFSVDKDEVILKMHLAAGSENNLKPEIVIDKLCELTDLSITADETRIQRLDLLKEENGEYITPLDKINTTV